MATYQVLSYRLSGGVPTAPTPENLLEWQFGDWSTAQVTANATTITAIRNGDTLTLTGDFVFDLVAGSWDGTVTGVRIDRAGGTGGTVGSATLTGISVGLRPNVSVTSDPPTAFNVAGSLNFTPTTVLAGDDTFVGGAERDVINGYDGNDVITGGGGMDQLSGGALGNDLFLASSSDIVAGEIYNGGQQTDTLRITSGGGANLRGVTLTSVERLEIAVGVGQTLLFDGAQIGGLTGLQHMVSNGAFMNPQTLGSVDASALTFDNAANFSFIYNGTSGADTFRAANTPFNTFDAGAGADTIIGNAGADFLILRPGDLPTTGPAEFIDLGGGVDRLWIFADQDFTRHTLLATYEEIAFSGTTTTVTLNAVQMATAPGTMVQGSGGPHTLVIKNAPVLNLASVTFNPAWTASTTSIISIEGTAGNDQITASSRGDRIALLGGTDTIDAGGGDDRIVKTGGDGTVDGGAGTDTLVVTGNTSLRLDNLETLRFGDAAAGISGADAGFVTEANFTGFFNFFTLSSVVGATGKQTFQVESSNQTIGILNLGGVTFSDWDESEGDAVSMFIRFNAGAVIGTNVADEVISEFGGRDVGFQLGAGDDVLWISEVGGTFGGGYDGGAGNDRLDVLYGLITSNLVVDLTGFTIANVEALRFSNILDLTMSGASFGGPTGIQTVETFLPNFGFDPLTFTIRGASIDMTSTTWIGSTRPLATIIEGTAGADTVRLGAFDVTRVSTGDGADDIVGSTAGEEIIGGAGVDRMSGAGGDDTIWYSPEDELIDGGAGFDTARATTNDGLTIRMDAWNIEQLFAGGGSDAIFTFGTAAYRVDAGAGNDTVSGNVFGDILGGNIGNDVLDGRQGNDTLGGGAGSDRLLGGEGADTLFGEGDPDSYIYRGLIDAGDTIIGFETAALRGGNGDKLEIVRGGFLQPGQANLGALDPARFVAGPATLATGQFLFDTNTGRLFWDGDGTGAGVAQLLLTVQGVNNLSAADFVLV